MNTLLDRFLRYVRIDTQSDEDSDSYPSTAKQLDLLRLLATELKELGLRVIENPKPPPEPPKPPPD